MSFSLSPLFAGFFIAEWAIRIIMLFVVPKRHRPSTANAWLMFIMLTPTLGAIAFFMFGDPKLPKSRMAKRKQVDRLTKKELAQIQLRQPELFATLSNDDHETLAQLATFLGGLPPMNSNKVELLAGYDEVFRAAAKEIDNAQEYVHIQYFIAVLDDATRPVFEALERAARRGVKVRFMYDKVVSARHKGYKPMRAFLESSSIEHKEMLPLSLWPGKNFMRPDLRNHRKILIIDGTTVLSGSQNLIDKTYHRKDNIVYEELVVKLQGPVVWQYNNVFRSDWFAETGEKLLDIVEDNDMPRAAGDVIAQVLPSGPSHEYENNLQFYTSMVYAAKKRVGIVVPYFIPDESFLDALVAAAQRGVEVTIVNSEAIDKVLAAHAQRSYYEGMLNAGIKIYLYREPVFLHTKQVIIDDDVAIIGSSNLDIRSFELDLEVNITIYDKAVVKQLDEIEQQYIAKSRRISKKRWLQRSLRHRMLDRLSRLTAGLQ